MRVPQTYNNKSLIHLWAYDNKDGQLLGAVGRYEKAGEKKEVVPFLKSDGNGGFSAGIDITPRPLFGLYKLANHDKSKAVFIPEGEKCASIVDPIVQTIFCLV